MPASRLWTPRNHGLRVPFASLVSPVSAPDSAGLSVVGDLEIVTCVRCPNWASGFNQPVIAKWGGSTTRSYMLGVNFQFLTLFWTTNGATLIQLNSSIVVPFKNGTHAWLRVTFDVDNGAAGRTATFYFSLDPIHTPIDEVHWTQFGAAVTSATATSIFDSTAAVELGSHNAGAVNWTSNPMIYCAQIRNGLGGTVVAQPDFRRTRPGAPSMTDPQGNVWTIGAGAIAA